jgi:hypothetical protein
MSYMAAVCTELLQSRIAKVQLMEGQLSNSGDSQKACSPAEKGHECGFSDYDIAIRLISEFRSRKTSGASCSAVRVNDVVVQVGRAAVFPPEVLQNSNAIPGTPSIPNPNLT